ncbi:MAG: DUF1080 domain-containing protein [Gemmataceae bacterium]|nr:DUF1080 domain-containing protein [Gemmataceae bacterium]
MASAGRFVETKAPLAAESTPMQFLGYFLVVALGVAFLLIGWKGFTAAGLQLTPKTRLRGTSGKIVGSVCVLLGLAVLAFAVIDLVVRSNAPPKPNGAPSVPPPPAERKPSVDGPAEMGYGLEARDPAIGKISLFDGKTAFGWKGARVEGGMLVGGESTIPFHHFGLSVDMAKPGTIVQGRERSKYQEGQREGHLYTPFGRIRLEDGAAARKLKLSIMFLGINDDLMPRHLEGWKNLGDGPGRWEDGAEGIQAKGACAVEYAGLEGLFGDFVLCMEARTSRKGAKGSAWVRCEPGKPGSGIELPIFHACEGDDLDRPAPRSTGSIGDKTRARRLVSRDHQRFVLTVVASGPHLGVWVNGSHQSDWRDDALPQKPGTFRFQAEDGAFQVLRVRVLRGVAKDEQKEPRKEKEGSKDR